MTSNRGSSVKRVRVALLLTGSALLAFPTGSFPSRRRPFFRPQLERDDPLNLSILLRGGKENNDDSLSKGD